jgi:hypothetical protein
MNNILKKKNLNFFIFLLLLIQICILYFDNRPSSQVFEKKNMSVENFSSIIFTNSGITKISSEKLNKIDDENFFLKGKSYLENKNYKIYGEDISISLKQNTSFSKKPVKVINSMGTLRAKSFKNIDSEERIYFDGQIFFNFND